MFEDILVKKPKLVAKLEKNGEILENAVIDLSKYENTYEGFITCPDLEVTDYDDFWLHLMYTKDTDITRRTVRIFIKQDLYGRFKFTIAMG